MDPNGFCNLQLGSVHTLQLEMLLYFMYLVRGKDGGFADLKPEEYEFISPGDFTTFQTTPVRVGLMLTVLSVT